ncbi:hypothetical protein L6164_031337 [Bauhinia variegata]|uniref:Uncharacterized protein n=1 Tax=Bauhinia variegata TaxID=167791 RepID=A0ACB9LF53_BAUVA|nr:hypothetical protein L6164_031337 [Bauhinia variegata]
MPSFATDQIRGNSSLCTCFCKFETGVEQCRFRDNGGRIPLIRGRVAVIEVLVSHSAESLVEVTERGESVVNLAAKNNHSQALQVLIEKMKEHEILGEMFGAKDKDEGKTFWELQTTGQSEYEKVNYLVN